MCDLSYDELKRDILVFNRRPSGEGVEATTNDDGPKFGGPMNEWGYW